MSNLNFKDYMEMNVQFNYLKGYYKSSDVASIYGVERMEIKHSNFLKWLFEPKKDTNEKAIEYLPIRRLLKLLQNNNQYYDYLNSVNIDDASIDNVKIMREKHNIDLLMILKIDGEDYIIAIENKLESPIHGDQLNVYKDVILNKYNSYKPVLVFLHPGFKINLEQKQEVQDYKYIPITYQELYDNILKDVLEFTNNSEIRLMLSYYIHSLACNSSDAVQGLIVTDKEKKCLKSLFEDERILKMIDSLYNGENNEYAEFYYENKRLFLQIFRKFETLYTDDDKFNLTVKFRCDLANKYSDGKIDFSDFECMVSKFDDDLNNLSKKINEIIIDRTYLFNGEHYNGVGELLKQVFEILLDKYNVDELKDLINLYPESVPLLIEEHEIDKLRTKSQKNWYLNNPKPINKDGKKYYVLSAWTLNEYEDLKERINDLSKTNLEIYRNIAIE